MPGPPSSTSAKASRAAPKPPLRAPLLAALLAALLATPASGAPAETPLDPEAKQHLDRALGLYQEGDYPAAIEAFKAGYAIDPRRDFLYAWAQAERLSGDCVTATELYKRFITLSASGMQVAAAEQGLELCAREIKEQRERAAQRDAEAEAAAAAAQAEREAEDRARAEAQAQAEARAEAERDRARRFYRDPLGGALLGGGLALGLTGGALLTAAHIKQSQLLDAPTYGDFAANYDDVVGGARSLRIAGGALLGPCVALIAGGVARWMIVRSGRGAKGSAWISPQPAGVTVGGRF
jgi:tetratricopeptide (TPR) repeat protein